MSDVFLYIYFIFKSHTLLNTLHVFYIYNNNNLHPFSIFYTISIFSFPSKCVAWKYSICIVNPVGILRLRLHLCATFKSNRTITHGGIAFKLYVFNTNFDHMMHGLWDTICWKLCDLNLTFKDHIIYVNWKIFLWLYMRFILAQIDHKGPNWTFLTLKMTFRVIPHLSYLQIWLYREDKWCNKFGQHFVTTE